MVFKYEAANARISHFMTLIVNADDIGAQNHPNLGTMHSIAYAPNYALTILELSEYSTFQ